MWLVFRGRCVISLMSWKFKAKHYLHRKRRKGVWCAWWHLEILVRSLWCSVFFLQVSYKFFRSRSSWVEIAFLSISSLPLLTTSQCLCVWGCVCVCSTCASFGGCVELCLWFPSVMINVIILLPFNTSSLVATIIICCGYAIAMGCAASRKMCDKKRLSWGWGVWRRAPYKRECGLCVKTILQHTQGHTTVMMLPLLPPPPLQHGWILIGSLFSLLHTLHIFNFCDSNRLLPPPPYVSDCACSRQPATRAAPCHSPACLPCTVSVWFRYGNIIFLLDSLDCRAEQQRTAFSHSRDAYCTSWHISTSAQVWICALRVLRV